MSMIKSADLHCLATAFLSNTIDETEKCLTCIGIIVKNSDGTYKPFNKVMDQIYALSVQR